MIKQSIEIYRTAKQFLESDTPPAKTTIIVLALVALGAIVSVGAVAPNVFQVFGRKSRWKRTRRQVYTALQSLRRHGCVSIEEKGSKTIVTLTTKGKNRVLSLSIESLAIIKPKKWDGKWRVVVFDIPVRLSKARDELRWKIKEMGFYQFQKSTWIYPYPCEDEVLFVASFFGVDKCIEIFTVTEMMSDASMRRVFSLP